MNDLTSNIRAGLMDHESFERLSSYITEVYGIKLPPSKRSMLESRLNRKMKSLGILSYQEFINHIFLEEGKADLAEVVDLITTNKTDFFREPHHFRHLTNEVLPAFEQDGRNNIKIWSAGCSTGEEPYTIVMTLEEFKKRNSGFTYNLMASDISTRVIQKAHQGIYPVAIMSDIPVDLKRSYFLRSKNNPEIARVKPNYRRKVQFGRFNLISDDLKLRRDLDIIFCRNVLIYFDKPTQELVLRKFCSYLRTGGLLFLGHSESIMGMDLPLTQINTTTYQVA